MKKEETLQEEHFRHLPEMLLLLAESLLWYQILFCGNFYCKKSRINKTETIHKKLENNRMLRYGHKVKQKHKNTKIRRKIKMAKMADMNEKIAKTVTEGYKKIEDGVVEGFNKVSDKFIDVLFTKEGESVEDARKRLSEKE